VQVYRVAEPDPALAPPTLDGVEQLVLQYPDGAHNAETLLSDPQTGDLFIVTKAASGASRVFRAPFPQPVGRTIELEPIAELGFGVGQLPGSTLTTGGDISPAGDVIAVRTYSGAFAWRRADGWTIAEAFATEPCPLPTMPEPQGEALAIGSDGFFTLSEGTSQPIWFFAAQ
jgi:hypothetical protein